MPGESRPPRQAWMSYSMEPQDMSVLKFSQSAFNVTVSFSRSTDIYLPYNYFYRTSNTTVDMTAILAEKRLPIVWAVSHCVTSSRREDYVTELRRHARVDTIGKCGNATVCAALDHDCERRLFAGYYFYLAFENSICEDYITEKLFSRMSQNLVPVVLGGGDYARDLPPHSYIDIADFASPKHLADYLLMLIDSPVEYAQYHVWRYDYAIGQHDELCVFCRYMNENEGRTKVIPNVNEVFGSSQCTNYTKYYKSSYQIPI